MKNHDLKFSRSHGFTLIEVLLAALIAALIGGSLYATFVAGITLESRMNHVFLDLDESRIVMEQIQHDLGRVVHYDFRGSFPEQKCFTDDGAQWIFLIDDNGAWRWVRYRLIFAPEGKIQKTHLGTTTTRNTTVENFTITEQSALTLVREVGEFIPQERSDKVFGEGQREVLTRRIPDKGWNIYFANTITPPNKIEWRTRWDEEYLPAAVRIDFSLRTKNSVVRNFVREYILFAGGQNE